MMFHHCATPHTAWQTQWFFQQYGWEVLQHLTCISNLAPSDFYLFSPLKWHLCGQWFMNDDVIVAVTGSLLALDHNLFAKSFNTLVLHCTSSSTCRGGDYVEKYITESA
jgi:hypothetical protein